MKKIIGIFLCFVFFSCHKERFAYIDIQKVFNQFEYKKELEKELTGIKNSRKFTLDSMETYLKGLSNKIRMEPKNLTLIAEFKSEKEMFLYRRNKFEEEEENLVKALDTKIISQLNSYVKQFGKENDYQMILGATNSGNVMYSDTTLDVSKKVIEYINLKYKGK